MKKCNLDKQGFLSKKENNLYKLSFGLLSAACFVAIPLFNIANACENTILAIASGSSTAVLSIGSMASAAAADKSKNIKEEKEKEL